MEAWSYWMTSYYYELVQFSSVAQSCLTLWDPMDNSTPGFLVRRQLPEFTQTHVHWVGDAIQQSHSLSSPSIFPSIRVLSSGSVLCIKWPNYWSFSFNISPSIEHSGLISFRMDWLDLLAVQGTLKSHLQHTVQKHQFLWVHGCICVAIRPGCWGHICRVPSLSLTSCWNLGTTLFSPFRVLARPGPA